MQPAFSSRTDGDTVGNGRRLQLIQAGAKFQIQVRMFRSVTFDVALTVY
jgi:hypothetical protein